MHVRIVHATNSSTEQLSLAAVRAAVLGRRVKASPSVAALLGELCFGGAGSDDVAATSLMQTGSR